MVNFVMLMFTGLFADLKEQHNTGGFITDQKGRYVVYHEDDKQQINEDLNLQEHINEFFKLKAAALEESGQGRVAVKGKTMLKKHAGMGNYVAGDVVYNMIFEKTDTGYRYWFTDLAYQPYVKDRFGKLVAAKVKPIPLEKQMSHMNQNVWAKQREFAYQTISALSDSFNMHLQKIDQPKVIQLN